MFETIALLLGLTMTVGGVGLFLSSWLEPDVKSFKLVVGFACGSAIVTALCCAFTFAASTV
jgi:hypothetical protein